MAEMVAPSRPGFQASIAWIRAQPWLTWLLGALPLVALIALFQVTDFRGLDFGWHWDEGDWHIDPGREMVRSGIFLPHKYIYPGFDKFLVLLPCLPAGIGAWLSGAQPSVIQAAMLAKFDSPNYLLSVRAVFVVVSSFAILWVYCAALALRYRRWEAFLAAAALGLSWQYAYHARWAVTDCILVQFTAQTIFTLAMFHRTQKPFWIYCAAVSAGLCTGTKYTGVLTLVPVLYLSALSMPWRAFWPQVRRAAALCGIALLVYMITTPATLLEPFTWLNDTRTISAYYMTKHGGYTATSGLNHAWLVISFFAFGFFSPYLAVSVVLFLITLAGAVLWIRNDRRFAVILVGFPTVFLTLFCYRYRIVCVRNYLFLTPFMVLLLARAVGAFVDWLRQPWQRWGVAAVLVVVAGAQAWWLIAAGESIRHFDPKTYARQALEYIKIHTDQQFRISNRIRVLAREQNLELPANVVTGNKGTRVAFFADGEGPGPWHWETNDPWLTIAIFGPREVDFNWYASWGQTRDRVVIMTLDRARRMGVPLAK